MIPFHKPRVFRSPTGCCICKTKTSSSRFTDSKKYETDFMNCFNLIEQRTGQICNACVLLVKRWKKLPDKFDRNWNHVVDARAGPGTKSLMRYRNGKKSKRSNNSITPIKKKHRYIKKGGGSIGEDDPEEGEVEDSPIPSPCPSPFPLYEIPLSRLNEEPITCLGEKPLQGSQRRKQRNPSQMKPNEFMFPFYWRQENVCCGTVYVDEQRGAVMVDTRLFVPCGCRSALEKNQLEDIPSSTLAMSPLIDLSPTINTLPSLSCSALMSPIHAATPQITFTSDSGSHYGDDLSETNLSDDSLDNRLNDSCYSSAANSPTHEPAATATPLLHHHMASQPVS